MGNGETHSGSRVALIGLIDDPDERRRRSEAARAYALSQSWDEIMGALRARYQRVIGEAQTEVAGAVGSQEA